MTKKKIVIIVVALVAIIAIAAGVVTILHSDKKPKPPEQFELNGVVLPALPVEQEEEFSVLESEDIMEGVSQSGQDTEEFQELSSGLLNPALIRTYTYANLKDPKQIAQKYTEMLQAEGMGFYPVDESFMKLKEIDWESPESKLMLARQETGETGVLMRVDITWTVDTCMVELYADQGQIMDELPVKTITYLEAAEYIAKFPPSMLELPGESMEDYRIYTLDGCVLIDGQSCIRLNIYNDDMPLDTNELAGRFYLSSDGRHFYRLIDENTVKEIDLSEYAKEHNLM